MPMLGVVKLVPVPDDEPPVSVVYQFTVPALAVAPSATVPASQRTPGVVAVMMGAAQIEMRASRPRAVPA